MPLEFHQLCSFVDKDGEAQSLCGGTPSRRENRQGIPVPHGIGRETGPLPVLSKILLPCPPVPCVRCSLSPGQKQQWDEKALSSGGPTFTLKDSSLGCSWSCLFVWYQGPFLLFYGIKNILPIALLLLLTCFCWTPENSKLCLGAWVQEWTKTVSVYRDLQPSKPRVHKQLGP